MKTISQIIRDGNLKLFTIIGEANYSNGSNFYLAFLPVIRGYVPQYVVKELLKFGNKKAYGQEKKPKDAPYTILSGGYGVEMIDNPDVVQQMISNAKSGGTKHIWTYYDANTKKVKEIKWK